MTTATAELVIDYPVTLAPESWGTDDSAAILIAADNLVDLISVYIDNHYPEASSSVYTTSEYARPACHSDGILTDDVTEEIQEFVSRVWTDEPLWAEGFDAQSYYRTYQERRRH